MSAAGRQTAGKAKRRRPGRAREALQRPRASSRAMPRLWRPPPERPLRRHSAAACPPRSSAGGGACTGLPVQHMPLFVSSSSVCFSRVLPAAARRGGWRAACGRDGARRPGPGRRGGCSADFGLVAGAPQLLCACFRAGGRPAALWQRAGAVPRRVAGFWQRVRVAEGESACPALPRQAGLAADARRLFSFQVYTLVLAAGMGGLLLGYNSSNIAVALPVRARPAPARAAPPGNARAVRLRQPAGAPRAHCTHARAAGGVSSRQPRRAAAAAARSDADAPARAASASCWSAPSRTWRPATC